MHLAKLETNSRARLPVSLDDTLALGCSDCCTQARFVQNQSSSCRPISMSRCSRSKQDSAREERSLIATGLTKQSSSISFSALLLYILNGGEDVASVVHSRSV